MGEVRVPDIGDFDVVDVVEVLVEEGQRVEADDPLITLESDKASMDVPAPEAGAVTKVAVSVGDQVGEGDLIAVLETEKEREEAAAEPKKGREKEQEDEETAIEEDVRPQERDEDEKEEEKVGEEEAAAAAEEERGEPEREAEPAEEEKREKRKEERPTEERRLGERAARPSGEKRRRADVLVLGSGPGGYTAAFRAADLGKNVVLVERYPVLGGVCLNVGCIPSKALLHLAEVLGEVEELEGKGIALGEASFDLRQMRGWKEQVVGRLTKGLSQMAEKRGVRVVQGTGRFGGEHSLLVESEEGEREIEFDRAIIAVGSRVARLSGVPWDDDRVWDSTAALELREIPERLLVVGGGIIGLEMATVYDALGSKVTVVELLDRLMAGADRDLVKPLERRIRKRYEAIHLETAVADVQAQEEGLEVRFEAAGEDGEDPESQVFDGVLVAVGRRANGDRIGAEAAGVEVSENGTISVDAEQRTNVEHVFAIGDVVGEPMLAHKATHQGKVAAEVAAGEKSGFEARVVPAVAYTDPEVAWVGLGEEQAREQGIEVEKGTFPWSASGRALGLGRSDGLTKLLFDSETGRIVGGGVVGPRAGDLIAEIAHAIEMGSDARDIALTVHPHPTLSETVAFAAEVAEGTVTDLYLPKGDKRQK